MSSSPGCEVPTPDGDAEVTVSSAVYPQSGSSARKARRYGFACSSCKSRKVKCSGEQPACRACERNGEKCVYPSRHSAESRLQHANAHIRRLEASLRKSSRNPVSVSVSDPQEEGNHQGRRSAQQGSALPNPRSGTNPNSSPAADGAYTSPETGLWFQVGLGEDGAIVYNGPTSRFHAGSLEETDRCTVMGENDSQAQLISGSKRVAHVETLKSQYSLMDSVWLPLIQAKPTMYGTGVDTKVGLALFDIYWTWLHPLHNCVYRPCLIMDLALGGQYCSDFLLMCIFALAARHLPDQDASFPESIGKGEKFVVRAKELLLSEFSAIKPSIPTIQGLLILGGRQCAVGKSSEGWLYTGMAIRMMIDIGLHLDTPRLAELQRWTPADTEARKRLYNSAYIWDKTLSLALGRPPSLIRRPYSSAEILDKFDDERSWEPIHATEIGCVYAPTASWNSTAFCAFCELHILTTEMMLLFSSMHRTDGIALQIESIGAKFQAWYDELPQSLKIEDPGALERSPPPHIVSLNLLYHALHILLRRPYLSSQDSKLKVQSTRTCITHSERIHNIHTVYARTFPHRLMTYQISYCIFTAATVEAQMLKTAPNQVDRDAAAARLAYAVRILQAEASHTPGSGPSLDTIRRLLTAGLEYPTPPGPNATAGPTARQGEQTASLRQNEDAFHETGEGTEAVDTQSSILNTVNMAQQNGPLFVGEDLSSSVFGGGFSWGDEFGRTELDTGAGFHPDAFSWALADYYPRASSQAWCPSARNYGLG